MRLYVLLTCCACDNDCSDVIIGDCVYLGMYGLILVEPEYNTLPSVDHEYYVI